MERSVDTRFLSTWTGESSMVCATLASDISYLDRQKRVTHDFLLLFYGLQNVWWPEEFTVFSSNARLRSVLAMVACR